MSGYKTTLRGITLGRGPNMRDSLSYLNTVHVLKKHVMHYVPFIFLEIIYVIILVA